MENNLDDKLKALELKFEEQAERIKVLEENSEKILKYLEKKLEKPEVIEAVPVEVQGVPRVELPPPPPLYEPEAEEKMFGTVGWAKAKLGGTELQWETIFGGNWMVKIGVAALVLGAGFFLKLAFENDWIGETGRVILGIFGGFALIGAGEYWQKKYPLYSQILTGGGIAILYLTFYAAHAFYDVIREPYVAFIFMGLVTLISGGLALRYNKPTIALIGILGGFFTPFMFAEKVGEMTLMVYTLLLDAGILLISSVRNWRPLTIAGLVGSGLLFVFWYSRLERPDEKIFTAETFLTFVFLIFAFATILWHFIWKKAAQHTDLALMVANAWGYFGLSYMLLEGEYGDWLGFFAFALAIFYAVLAYAALARAEKDFRLTMFLGGIALVFLTIAVPIQISQMNLDGSWITIAWAIEGLVLVGTGLAIRSYQLRIGALAVLLLVAIRLIFFDTYWPHNEEFTVILNIRFLTFLISIVSIFMSAHLYYKSRDILREEEKKIFPILLLVGNFFILWALSMEIITYFDQKIRLLRDTPYFSPEPTPQPPYDRSVIPPPKPVNYEAVRNLEYARNFSLSAFWAVYSIILIAVGIFKKIKVLRIAGLVLFWITILKVFLFDVFIIKKGYRVASLISLGVILLITGYFYQRFRDRIKEFIKGS